MLELFLAGGVFMWPLLLGSALMVAIVIERFWSLRRSSVLPAGLGAEVASLLRSRRVDAEHIQALRQHSPLGRVLATAVAERHRPHTYLVSRIEDTGRDVVHGLNRWMNTLGTIAIIAPMVGLLGTVSGMIRMFLVITEFGVGDANRLAGGIGEALLTTALGLLVAIPAYVFHRYFRGRIQEYGLAMAREASQLIEVIEATPPPDKVKPRAA